MRMLIVLICGLTTGCSTIVSNLPTMEYCHEVLYNRLGNDITFAARCKTTGRDNLPVVPKI